MQPELYTAPFPPQIHAAWTVFLSSRGLRDEGSADTLALLRDGEDTILACAALSGQTLKEIAVRADAEGTGACAAVVSALLSAAYRLGRDPLLLCTKPERKRLFASMGFFPLAETPDTLLMENRKDGLSRYLGSLPHPGGVVGAIVANCNPFTLGHQSLIEQAAAVCDAVHVFLLSEDASLFSAKDRFAMAQSGTAYLPNCFVHAGGPYLISRATFPAYFIKDAMHAEDVRADLDLTLFGKRIAPALGITRRYVGEEPYCPVTRAYNARMHALLPQYGVEVVELPRKDGISASRVRALLQTCDLSAVRSLVPETTYAILLRRSEGGA